MQHSGMRGKRKEPLSRRSHSRAGHPDGPGTTAHNQLKLQTSAAQHLEHPVKTHSISQLCSPKARARPGRKAAGNPCTDSRFPGNREHALPETIAVMRLFPLQAAVASCDEEAPECAENAAHRLRVKRRSPCDLDSRSFITGYIQNLSPAQKSGTLHQRTPEARRRLPPP